MQDALSIFLSVWFLNPNAQNPALPDTLRRILPGVHAIRETGANWEISSAGLSLASFGKLEANAYDPPIGPRQLRFLIPRVAKQAEKSISLPLGAIGAFVTGMPIYNPASIASYNNQGIWHRDAVREHGSQGTLLTTLLAKNDAHSPILGYALDGYPIYGPYTPARMRSSYRPRAIATRTSLPDGTRLTPGQYGPPVSEAEPLGAFIEDYEYQAGSGDLDIHNGRYAVTPEFPSGTYAYYLATDALGNPCYPYLIGPTYFGAPAAPAPKQLRFSVTGVDGNKQRFPELIHEKPLHLILVSDDMQDFQHVHPELGPDDEFGIDPKFPRSTRYHAFAQSTAAGGVDHVEHRVIDGIQTADSPNTKPSTIKVQLIAQPLITGKDLRLRFVLTDKATGGSIDDLEPYLGAWGHFIAISYDKQAFLHAHPRGGPEAAQHDHAKPIGPSPDAIEIEIGFDQPGRYRLWAQFQRGGVEMNVPFDLDVQRGTARAKKPAPPGRTRITVGSSGYTPAELVAPAGSPLRLAFERIGNTNCGSKVIFPDFGITRDLPAGEIVEIDLPALQGGTYRFTCGMGMYRGAIVAR